MELDLPGHLPPHGVLGVGFCAAEFLYTFQRGRWGRRDKRIQFPSGQGVTHHMDGVDAVVFAAARDNEQTSHGHVFEAPCRVS